MTPSANSTTPIREDPKPSPGWILIVGIICTVLGAGTAAYYVFLWVLGTFQVEPFEAARTAVTLIGVPTAAGAVFVALRNLRLKERQDHTDKQRLVDAQRAYDLSYDAEHNRRKIERETQLRARYVSAAEQIGNSSAAVRLAGINAMAQLADDWTDQRQACVDVLCAYLRLPQLRVQQTLDEADAVVRTTAQQLLTEGLRRQRKTLGGGVKWPNMVLDLRGAVLSDFRLTTGAVRTGNFSHAVFEGDASFIGSHFVNASFRNTEFRGSATFSACTFARANFHETRFGSTAKFRGTIFEGMSNFAEVTFDGAVILDRVNAERPLNFIRTKFKTAPKFSGPNFDSKVRGCTENGYKLLDYNLGTDTVTVDDEELAEAITD